MKKAAEEFASDLQSDTKATVKGAGESVAHGYQEGADRTRKGVVYFITNDKNLQAIKTGVAVGIVVKTVNVLSVGTQLIVGVPDWLVALALLAVVWRFATWADDNTEEWRNLVEKAPGVDEEDVEEAADG